MFRIQSKKRNGYWAFANPYKYLKGDWAKLLTITLIGWAMGAILLIVGFLAPYSSVVAAGAACFALAFGGAVLIYGETQKEINRQTGRYDLVDRDLVSDSDYDA